VNEEERLDWNGFIAWLDSSDAYEKCFDADTAHACLAADAEIKRLRKAIDWACGDKLVPFSGQLPDGVRQELRRRASGEGREG